MVFQVENVIQQLNKTFPDDGLLPIYIDPRSGTKSYSTITFGAMGDRYSHLEYSDESCHCALFFLYIF